ncbi:MAG: ABC transporter ATP-binding protein [Thermoleophilia bacterium]|nr:ABC transporter ATP-binding protein [Thermoleophilia bacterium]
MNDLAIRTQRLGKMYHIGAEAAEYHTLRDAITNVVKRPIERIRNPGATTQTSETLWALRNIDLEIRHGDVLGIVGRNGSGKSTLLKVLSRITEPTEGRAEIWGRVGSLLEVGTGFHGELTGRENIQLNGAILGMKRAEIKSRFDEIVEFSEIGQFLDTPVKRYSSGMYVRLAFAVAAHLNPEILIVDEVLAVGDAEFQRKCLGRMGKVAREGRTVLFVSHNMGAVRNLCTRAIQLANGRIVHEGDTTEVTEAYLRGASAESLDSLADAVRAFPSDPAFRLDGITVRQGGRETLTILSGQPFEVEYRYTVPERLIGLRVFFDLVDDEQTALFRSHHDDHGASMSTVDPGQYVSTATVPADLLATRQYELRINARLGNGLIIAGDGIGVPIAVESSGTFNQAYKSRMRFKLQPRVAWETSKVSDEVYPVATTDG